MTLMQQSLTVLTAFIIYSRQSWMSGQSGQSIIIIFTFIVGRVVPAEAFRLKNKIRRS